MRDPLVVVAVVGLLGTLSTGLFAWRSHRQEAQVAKDAGYITGYSHLVDDLQEEIDRLRTQIKDLRADNDLLYGEVRQLREQITALTDALPRLGGSP